MTRKFAKSLSDPDPIPNKGIARATELMRSGRLFRYGEQGAEELEVRLLEEAFSEYLGLPYACAVNSGGCALFLALKALGVAPGDPVLVNAFTLAPVPGAIDHAGARPVLVVVTENYLIDLRDLERKVRESGARVLLLSHMRGHIADMDAVLRLCDKHNLLLVEDCAHTLGARWRGKHLGTFGAAGCYSAQTFKHINSGEGGLVATRDEDIAARVVLHSGSYMLYKQNGARPPDRVFERWRDVTPNYSMRMSALQAALLRPQLGLLEERAARWNERYAWLTDGLETISQLRLPERSAEASFVASSLQFTLQGLSEAQLETFQQSCDAQGVHLKWFGRAEALGFTSTHKTWAYLGANSLERTDGVMRGLFDMRIPLSLNREDCSAICAIIAAAVQTARRG